MTALSNDAAARIIRRASEIDTPRHPHRGTSTEALRQAASEVGISDEAVLRAIAEEHLSAELDLGERSGDWLCGPDRIVAFVEGPANSMERLDRWMRRSAQLRRVPTTTDVVLYERRGDALAHVQRAVRRVGGATRLSRPPRLSVMAVPMGGRSDRQLVAVVAELRRERLMASGLAALVGIGGLVAAVAAAASSSLGFLALAPVAIGVGVGIAIGRRSSVASVQRQLEGSVVSAISREVPNHKASIIVDSAVDGISWIGARVRADRSATGTAEQGAGSPSTG